MTVNKLTEKNRIVCTQWGRQWQKPVSGGAVILRPMFEALVLHC